MGNYSGLPEWLNMITSVPKGVREEDVTVKMEHQSDTALLALKMEEWIVS